MGSGISYTIEQWPSLVYAIVVVNKLPEISVVLRQIIAWIIVLLSKIITWLLCIQMW